MANQGLSVGDVVNVSVSLSPSAAALRSFGIALFMGDSGFIDTQTRVRLYSSYQAVAADVGASAPEALAAAIYFAQTPQPAQCYIGAWARTATNGVLVGGSLSTAAQALANFSVVTNGGLTVTVDGEVHSLTAINLATVTNLNGVASAITDALAGAAVVTWNANNGFFQVTSATTGTGSAVSFGSASTGTDLSALMSLTAALGANAVNGIVAESALDAVSAVASITNAWYGLEFASSVMPSDSDHAAVSNFIQASSPSHIYAIGTTEATVASNSTSDVASLIANNRTAIQYSSATPHAAASMFGLSFPTNWLGANTGYTLKFKQAAGIVAETLTETQAAFLKAKNVNVYVNYDDGTGIMQEGVMSDGTFYDVIHGTDWLQNFIQTNVFNAFRAARKIPQLDSGVNTLVSVVCNSLDQGITNGLIGPGIWTGPDVGAIVTGQMLSKGYYVFAPPLSTQSITARAARQAPVMTCAIKLAGAFHSANVIINVNS
jgi:hypothetical protein